MDRSGQAKHQLSRRDFLKGAPAAIVGGIALSILVGRPLLSRLHRRQASSFPKGSIYTPASDQRKRA